MGMCIIFWGFKVLFKEFMILFVIRIGVLNIIIVKGKNIMVEKIFENY